MYETLKAILKEKNMTVKTLSEKSGVHPNTISNIKKEKISFNNMKKIADALDVSLDVFR